MAQNGNIEKVELNSAAIKAFLNSGELADAITSAAAQKIADRIAAKTGKTVRVERDNNRSERLLIQVTVEDYNLFNESSTGDVARSVNEVV